MAMAMLGHSDCSESVRSRQIAALKQVLNFNQTLPTSMAVEPVWKLLIIDKLARDIISPLMQLKELREAGVTLHMMLDSKRDCLPDVPAVYLVAPNEGNIHHICDDLRRALYDSYYVNMVGPIPRPLLEQLAEAAVEAGQVQQVQRVTDQFFNFISLEDDLFMLRKYSDEAPFSFHVINDPTTNADEMDAFIESVAAGLFAVCVTLGVIPVIKCSRNNAAEQVAERLDRKIRDNLRDARNNLFVQQPQEPFRVGQFNFQRPCLVLTDRSIDLSTMLHHTWTYQALIADVLGMELNRVRVKPRQAGLQGDAQQQQSRRKEQDYSMAKEDKLWTNFRGSPFPLVAEAIQEELDAYRKNEDEIKRIKETMGFEGLTAAGEDLDADPNSLLLSSTTAKLSTAVGSLPELLGRKRLIDMHTNMATTLLEHIKERKLDLLFETEEKLLNGQEFPIGDTLRHCSDMSDALRLILISACSAKALSPQEKSAYLTFMQEHGVDPSAFHFIQRLRTFLDMKTQHVDETNLLHQGAGTKTISMFSKLLSHSSKLMMEGVKNLVPRQHNLPLTKMVDHLIDTRQAGGVTASMAGMAGMAAGMAGMGSSSSISTASEQDEYRYFDPKVSQSTSGAGPRPRPNQFYTDVIVFVVGGGNYVEYQNIHDYGKSKVGMQRITYGCTEMTSPKQFLDQLTRLGKAFGQ